MPGTSQIKTTSNTPKPPGILLAVPASWATRKAAMKVQNEIDPAGRKAYSAPPSVIQSRQPSAKSAIVWPRVGGSTFHDKCRNKAEDNQAGNRGGAGRCRNFNG